MELLRGEAVGVRQPQEDNSVPVLHQRIRGVGKDSHAVVEDEVGDLLLEHAVIAPRVDSEAVVQALVELAAHGIVEGKGQTAAVVAIVDTFPIETALKQAVQVGRPLVIIVQQGLFTQRH